MEPFKILTAFLFFILAVLPGCGDLSEFDNMQIRQALGDSLLNSTETWGLNMEITEDGKKVLILTGSYSKTINDTEVKETRISGPVKIEITPGNNRKNSTVFCDSALYLPEKGIFEMFGNVRVFTSDGKRLRSEYLQWKRHEDLLSTPEFVIFISPPDSIAANGFKGNTDFTRYTLNEGGGEVVID